jgi:hypothetical protein
MNDIFVCGSTRAGKGTLVEASGAFYQGDWLGGFKHGHGVEVFSDDSHYVGAYRGM